MRKISKITLILALLLTPFVVFAGGGREAREEAQTDQSAPAEESTTMESETAEKLGELPGKMKRVSELLDASVSSNLNFSATVHDFVVDRAGTLSYAVMSFTGVEGVEGRVLVPANRLSVPENVSAEAITIGITPDDIAGAPVLEGSILPDTMSPEWDAVYHDYWQQRMTVTDESSGEQVGQVEDESAGDPEAAVDQQPMPTDEAAWGGRFAVLVTDLMSFDVVTRQGDMLGKVEDLVADFGVLGQPSVAYFAVSSGTALGAGAELHPIPFIAVNVEVDRREVELAIDSPDQLGAGFTQDNWPATVDESWMVQGEAPAAESTDTEATESEGAAESTDESATETEGTETETEGTESTTDTADDTATDESTTTDSGSETDTTEESE